MYYYQDLGRNLTADETDFNFDYLRAHYQNLLERNMPVALRSQIGRPLTGLDVDNNFQMLDTARLIMEYGDGPYPVFDQVFGAGARFLDPRITFTRPGDSYRIVNGVLRKYGINEPCLTGDGWSLRPAETNLWWPTDGSSRVSLANITRTDEDTYPGPDEDGKPSLLFQAQTGGTGGGGNRYLGLGSYSETINRKTISAIVRAKTASRFALRIQQPWPSRMDALFDLSTGALVDQHVSGFTSVATASTPLADGWWRFDLTGTRVDSAAFSANLGPTESLAASSYEVDDGTTPSAYVYAAWVNEGAPIPYIPTTSAAATRPADSALIQGDAFASVFNPMEGAILVRCTTEYFQDIQAVFGLPDTDIGPGYSELRLSYGNLLGMTLFANTPDVTSIGGGTYVPGSPLNAGLVWGGGDISLWIDGVKKGSVAKNMRASRFLGIGSRSGPSVAASILNAERLTIFNRRPSDAQMEAMTS